MTTGRQRRKKDTVKVTEKTIQQSIKRFLRLIGASVYDTSQPFRAAITPGVPDLIVFYRGSWTFAEVKTPRGRMTESQKQFRDECKASGAPWQCWYSAEDAVRWTEEVKGIHTRED